MNKVILLCNLTRDPQLSYTPAQVPVVDFGVACNKKWKGQDGQMHEEATFVDCRAFKRTAENINQYFHKGSKILIEGELHFSSWEKDGKKHSKLRVTVYQFDFVDSKGEQQAPQQQQQAPPQIPAYNPTDPSDIPF
jgi:single-strand DNA-binding protein